MHKRFGHLEAGRFLELESARPLNRSPQPRLTRHLAVGLILTSALFAGGPLGFVEQRFAYLHFEKDKWTRAAQPPCYVYAAREDNATLELLGIGSSDLVPFRTKKD
jgi:hypothetical protein